MRHAATIEFTDAETSDRACAIIRYDADAVAIGLSLKSNGDIQVVMQKKDAKTLLTALKVAVG